jgi:ferredoxin
VACIGCGKCEKVCKFDAITITSFLAYIDFEKCTLCRKCVEVCPTTAIWEVNFKPRKPKPADEQTKKVVSTETKPVELKVNTGTTKENKV